MTSQPVGKASPIDQTLGNGLQIGDDGGSRGGKAADHFEKGIEVIGNCSRKNKGETAQHTHDEPAGAYADHAFSGIEIRSSATGEKHQKHGQSGQNANGDQEAVNGSLFSEAEADQERGDHENGFDT